MNNISYQNHRDLNLSTYPHRNNRQVMTDTCVECLMFHRSASSMDDSKASSTLGAALFVLVSPKPTDDDEVKLLPTNSNRLVHFPKAPHS